MRPSRAFLLPLLATSLSIALSLPLSLALAEPFGRLADDHPEYRWGSVVRHGEGATPAVALTFDDGPSEPYTGQILDILRDQGVKATFFLIGENARRHPALVRRIAREGHAIGNHSWSHRSLGRVSRATVRSELRRTDDLLRSLTGRCPVLFRPPFGAVGQALSGPRSVVAERRQLLVLWSVEVSDWSTRSPLRVAAGTIRRINAGSIVLLHDGGGPRSHVVTATRWMVGHLARRGYDLVTVPELLGLEPR